MTATKRILAGAAIAAVLLAGCVTVDDGYYRDVEAHERFIRNMNALWCEDAALVGYAASYLGPEKWQELTAAFTAARAKNKRGPDCSPWTGSWYGRTIFRDSAGAPP